MNKLSAPAYYQKFSCIADRCRHSCCIGWEIDVDRKTLKKYKRLRDKAILASIAREGTTHFCLTEDERCPHLDEKGLCRIITAHGDGYLCEICREHPRFYNNTVKGREVGLGMSCEEACRLILSEEFTVLEIGKEKGRVHPLHFDALPAREKIYAVLLDDSLSYTQKLQRIAEEYGISVKANAALFSSLEYLKEENRVRFRDAFCPGTQAPVLLEDCLCRALAYFVYRHVTAARSWSELRMAVGFSLFCERLLCSLAVEEKAFTFDAFSGLARTLSEELEYSEENTEKIKLLFLGTA